MRRISKEVVIVNELGLHARAAAMISKIAQTASSTVWISKGEITVDASSILDILTLGCEKDTRITLEIDNPSDMDVLNNIGQMVECGFGEE